MSSYFVTPRAQADLDETWLYVAKDRPGAADRLIDRIIGHFSSLASNPELGASCAELAADLRQSTVGNYIVLYRPRPARVEIVRVIHGARDVAEEFKRHWPTE
jgi:toxin ParE1/3/4